MRAHEAGALHAEGYRGPAWLQTPVDVNALVPLLWATSVGRGGDGVLTVGGVSVTELAREFGTPAYIIDEDDFRSRARDFKQTYAEVFDSLSGGADVYYAGKAFLCTEVARWILDEGLHLDVCTGGELAVAKRAGVSRTSSRPRERGPWTTRSAPPSSPTRGCAASSATPRPPGSTGAPRPAWAS